MYYNIYVLLTSTPTFLSKVNNLGFKFLFMICRQKCAEIKTFWDLNSCQKVIFYSYQIEGDFCHVKISCIFKTGDCQIWMILHIGPMHCSKPLISLLVAYVNGCYDTLIESRHCS
jgi:hypothetical protein